MVNTGKPSTGCGRCRQRKIKCDEQKDACRNCIRIGKACPGYPNADDLRFRRTVFPVTPHTARNASRGVSNPPPARFVDLETVSNIEDCEDGLETSKWPLTVHKTVKGSEESSLSPEALSLTMLPYDVEDQVVCYSLTTFERNSRVLYNIDSFSFLPGLLEKASQDSCVRRAMAALSFTNFANRCGPGDLSLQRKLEYVRAINATNAALRDPNECISDETLVAVWLLGSNELIGEFSSGMPVGLSTGFKRQQLHADGTLALLRARGDKQFSTAFGRHLFRTILTAMHWRPLFYSHEQSAEFIHLESLLHRTGTDPVASLRVRSYYRQVTSLRAKVKKYLDAEKGTVSNPSRLVAEFIHAATQLDSSMNDWCDVKEWIPNHMVVKNENEESRPSSGIFTKYYFSGFPGFFHWNRFYIAHLTLHQAILHALLAGEAGEETEKLILHHTGILQQAATDFLGLVGYALGDVDGFGNQRAWISQTKGPHTRIEQHEFNINGALQVYPPLTYLQECEFLATDHKWAIRAVLERLTNAFRMI